MVKMAMQSLEFVAEMRILVEMNIENHGKKYFPWGKIDKHTFFSMKIKVMDLWMQIEGTKLIYIMNFSMLDFCKFASRTPQIAQILVLTFKLFPREHAPGPTHKFPLFYSLAIPDSAMGEPQTIQNLVSTVFWGHDPTTHLYPQVILIPWNSHTLSFHNHCKIKWTFENISLGLQNLVHKSYLKLCLKAWK